MMTSILPSPYLVKIRERLMLDNYYPRIECLEIPSVINLHYICLYLICQCNEYEDSRASIELS